MKPAMRLAVLHGAIKFRAVLWTCKKARLNRQAWQRILQFKAMAFLPLEWEMGKSRIRVMVIFQ